MSRRKTKHASLGEYSFFEFLLLFHQKQKGTIRKHYKDISKKYLDFNCKGRNVFF